jgi:DNA processing protein
MAKIIDPDDLSQGVNVIFDATGKTIKVQQGGSLITAHWANEYNREVFAVPGRCTDRFSQGCNTLIKTQRAHLLNNAADLMYHLNWELEPKSNTRGVQKQLFIELNSEEQQLYTILQQHG